MQCHSNDESVRKTDLATRNTETTGLLYMFEVIKYLILN